MAVGPNIKYYEKKPEVLSFELEKSENRKWTDVVNVGAETILLSLGL